VNRATEIVIPQSGFPTPRRRWGRYKVNVPVRVVTRRRGEIIVIEGHGSELNCGGMRVTLAPANAPAALDLYICEHVSVEFVLSEAEKPLTVKCVVRNRRRRSYGLEFIALCESGQEALSLVDSILHNFGAVARDS
jgi:hypothetical protein